MSPGIYFGELVDSVLVEPFFGFAAVPFFAFLAFLVFWVSAAGFEPSLLGALA
jgi:hypothetical protein